MELVAGRRALKALLALGIGAAATLVGDGAAHANPYCGTNGITVQEAGLRVVVNTTLPTSVRVCVTPPDQGVGVGIYDPTTAPGFTVEVFQCGPNATGCGWIVGYTGAEVRPTVPVTVTTGGIGDVSIDVHNGATVATVWRDGTRTNINVP